MMCRQIRPLLGPFEDDSLPQDDRATVVSHLAGCDACRERVERRHRLGSLLRSALDVPDPGEEYFRKQRAKLLAADPSSHAAGKSIVGRFIPIAALLAASALLLVYGPGLVRTSPPPQATPVLGSVAAKPASEAKPEALRIPPRPKDLSPVPPEAAPPVLPEPKPVPSAVPTPEKSVAPTPVVPTPREEPPKAIALTGPPAGSAVRMLRMTKEAVEVALAETPTERVVALCAAAEAQLRELEQAVPRDPQLAAELAGAYRLLVKEGVGGVLQDRAESPQDLNAARDEASRRVRGHEATLLALGGQSNGALKESLSLALEASRSLAGR